MKRVGIALVAVVLFTLPLWSQESAGAVEFKETLQQLLREEDWSREQIQKLVNEEVDWEQARLRDFEMVATCWEYAKEKDEEIGPYEQVQMALSVMTMAREMRSLGLGEPQIIRTALNGTRKALADLVQLREQERVRTGEDTEVGELIRTRFREQLQSALCLEARVMVQNRVREEQNSRPGDLLVPPGPQGPGGPGR